MERSFWSSIRGKLLSRTLLVVLFPLLVLGGAAVYAMFSLTQTADQSVAEARETLSEDVVGTRLADISEQIAREVALFLDERLVDVEGWSSDAGLVGGARIAAAQATQLGLSDLTIDEIEALFEDDPRLGNPTVERDLIAAVDAEPSFKEIFITDVNGFNVDFSNPTSDFVQSDEDWWINAMDTGLDISAPAFDASAGVFAVDVSIRLEDQGEPVGVLKAALDVALVQAISDRFTDGPEAFEVSLLDPEGRFLSETSSDHDPSHIMSSAYVAGVSFTNEAIAEGLSGDTSLHPDGYSIFEDRVAGFAHVADPLAAARGEMSAADARAFDWLVVVEQPADVAFASLAPLENLADQVSTTSSGLTILLISVMVIGALAAASMALILGRRIGSPIARLRDAAVQAAEVTLPDVVSRIDDMNEDEVMPPLEPLVLATGDEVEDLAHSFNSMQQTAVELASDQARLRRKNVATTFVNLGRRNQNLLTRQLEHINSMENTETDAETLRRLFQLDHLATRMRRNAESLLVLAGEETPRRFRQPVTMRQLLQAAGGEIEDYGRIELASIEEASVEGSVASDVAHLLAELLENASSFSPPGSPIQIHGRLRSNGYALAIIDQGIGMDEQDLALANSRLADPAEFDRAPSAYLGHFVVGHLARRHGIRVRVAESPYGGVTAQLHLPSTLLVTQQVLDRAPIPSIPASEMHETASPDTHVAASENDTARELAEIAALEASFAANSPEVPAVPVVDHAPEQTEATIDPPAEQAPTASESNGDVSDSAAVTPSADAAAVDGVLDRWLEESAGDPTRRTVEHPPATHTGAASGVPAVARREAAPPDVDASGSAALPLGSEETTPSGFRRRRRGHEGAPTATAAHVERAAEPPTRRTPEEVQASLARFRQGVESGRAHASHTNPADGSTDEGESR